MVERVDQVVLQLHGHGRGECRHGRVSGQEPGKRQWPFSTKSRPWRMAGLEKSKRSTRHRSFTKRRIDHGLQISVCSDISPA